MVDLILSALGDILSVYLLTWPEGKIARAVSVVLHLLVAGFVGLCVGAALARYTDDPFTTIYAMCGGTVYLGFIGWVIYRRATRD